MSPPAQGWEHNWPHGRQCDLERSRAMAPSRRRLSPISRYPIQTPREACYGDMDGFPGVRNYGVVDPSDLYDVYCYAEDLNGDWG